ncbi:MAG: cupin domain-containing protein [Bacteroidetes bacterium]|nr:cupin domain-containing protein [Bacteroidota bacterium]
MKSNLIPALTFAFVAFLAGWVLGDRHSVSTNSAVISRDGAGREVAEWGHFYTYFNQDTYGTKDVLAGVAVLKPGRQIHPPHLHAEEEYLMVLTGSGTWHLNGEEFPATAGDMLYAAPWDIHGITNSGTDSLSFVVWKWNAKGMAVPSKVSGQ